MFSRNKFKDNNKIIKSNTKIVRVSTYESIKMYPQFENALQFRFNEISEKKKNYFIAEIHEGLIMSKRLIRHIAAFDYVDKNLLVYGEI